VPQLCHIKIDEKLTLLISSCLDGTAMIRNATTGDWIGSLIGHKGAIKCTRSAPDCNIFGTASTDFSAKLWDGRTGELLKELKHDHMVLSCDFSEDQKFISGTKKSKIRVYNLKNPEAPPKIVDSPHGSVDFILCLSKHTFLTTGNSEPSITVWDAKSLNVLKTLKTPSSVTSLQLSYDRKSFTATSGSKLLLFDATDFSCIFEKTVEILEKPLTLNAGSLSPNRKYFCVGSTQEMDIRVFRTDTLELLRTKKGHHGPVHSLSWHPNGRGFAAGSEDGTVRIWPCNLDLEKKDYAHGNKSEITIKLPQKEEPGVE